MVRNILVLCVTFASILAPSALVTAQEAYTYPYAHVRYVEGEVQLQQATEPEPAEAGINHPVTQGDRLWTLAYARAEIEFSDGSLLRMEERTKIDFVDFGSSSREALLRLWSGSVILRLTTEQGSHLRLDTPAGSIYPASPGVFRIDVYDDGQSTVLSAYEGVAELASEGGSVLVRSGQRSLVEPGRRPEPSFEFNTARMDEFTAWSDERDRTYAQTTTIQGLPEEVEVYVDDLHDQGTWRVDPQLGSVWYPRVSTGWYPYSQGYWSFSIFGWTWISYEPWGWAPYHYGRWGFNNYGWHWIPGAHWGPAWVSWSIGPSYVGWCALGYYDRPVATPYYRGRYAVPRTRVGAGWSYAKAERGSRTLGRARLRSEDVRATAHQARQLESGAILDRNLEPRVIGAAAMTRVPRGGLAELRDREQSGALLQGGAAGTRGLARSRSAVSTTSPGELRRGSAVTSAIRRGGTSRSAVEAPTGGQASTSSRQATASRSRSAPSASQRRSEPRNPTTRRPGAIRRGGEARDESTRSESLSRGETMVRRSPATTRSTPSREQQSSDRFGASSALKRVERSLQSTRSTTRTGESSRAAAPSSQPTSKSRTGVTQRQKSRPPSSTLRGSDFFSRRPTGRTSTPPRSATPQRSRPTPRARAPQRSSGARSTGAARSTRSSSKPKSRPKKKN